MDEASGPPVEVWPDNILIVNTFIAMCSQWRHGFSGPTGLDYGALPVVLRLNGVPRPEWPEVFDGIRTMEDAALEKMRAK